MKKNKSLKWIIENSSFILPLVGLTCALAIVLSLCSVSLALASKEVVNIATGEAVGSLAKSSMALIGLIAAQIILQAVNSNVSIRITGKLMVRLKENIFRTLLGRDYKSVSSYHSGDLLNRINNDVNVVVTGVVDIAPSLLSFVTRLIAGFAVLFYLEPLFSCVFLVLGPVVLFASRVYSKKMKFYHKKCQECDGKISSFMQEAVQNILMIKSFSSEKYIVDKSALLQDEGYKVKIKRNTISIFANIGMYLIFSAGYYIALAWGAFRLSAGAITVGALIAYLQLINQVQTPFLNISSLIPKFYSMLASAERIIELESMPGEEKDEIIYDCKKIYDDLSHISVENIDFAYDNEPIFEGASYEIKKGDFVAIAGTSGLGKSTLVKLMLGIIKPTAGEIYAVMKSGEKIKLGASTRGLFSYVPQGNMILSGSVRDNIKFSNENATEGEIIAAAKTADIWDFISGLENGLDTVLGERGLGLSEGQVQRLAIARALLHNAPVLLFDEATSALDENTEKRVLENIKALPGVMCIIVSHKKAAIDICDEVISMKNGKITKL
ncbi:MAG: ABC transporter ATP-binding protein [Clostridia bacterium]|nr:ABC transporter ATP-binding protein [Clostridia bacterium]